MEMLEVKLSSFSTLDRFSGVQGKNEAALQTEMLICITLFCLTTCE